MKDCQPSHNLLTSESGPTIGEITKLLDYSNVSHLRRVTAYVLRAVKMFKASFSPSNQLTAEELGDAETLDCTCTITTNSGEGFQHLAERIGLICGRQRLVAVQRATREC